MRTTNHQESYKATKHIASGNTLEHCMRKQATDPYQNSMDIMEHPLEHRMRNL